MIDRSTNHLHPPSDYEMHRLQDGKCHVCIFVFKREPRVFIGGGESGYDSLASEADVVEIEALFERFGLEALRDVLVQRQRTPHQIDYAVKPAPEQICPDCKKGELIYTEEGMCLIIQCPRCGLRLATTSIRAVDEMCEKWLSQQQAERKDAAPLSPVNPPHDP